MELNITWFEKLKNHRLSRQDRQTLRRFLADPSSRLFLSVAEILKAYDLHHDCLDLLEYGVSQHANYGAARVILAREHFDHGHFARAQEILEQSPVSLQQNRLAQKILFKSCIVLGLFPEADQALIRLKAMEAKDEEINQASDMIDLYGHAKLRNKILERFANLPDREIQDQAKASTPEAKAPVAGSAKESKSVRDLLNRINLDALSHFKISKLADIYQGQVGYESEEIAKDGLSLELDSTTLADIFAAQGHYRRALGIYKRLAKLAPSNSHLRNKVRELSKLLEEQKNEDYEIDPDTIEKMENLDYFDRQIEFLQGMLDSLKP